LDFNALKVPGLISFVGFMFVLWRMTKHELGPLRTGIVLALVGFNPWFWEFKDEILSEYPFMMIVFGVIAYTLYVQSDRTRTPGLRQGIAAGVLIALATATRTAGLVLIPALALVAVFDWKRLWRFSVAGLAVAAVPCLLVLRMTSEKYASTWKICTLHTIGVNAIRYLEELSSFWASGAWNAFPEHAITTLILIAGVVGFLYSCSKAVRLSETFALAYLGLVLSYPCANVRFLLPVFPFVVFYAVKGAGVFSAAVHRKQARWVFLGSWLLLAALAGLYVRRYAAADYGASGFMGGFVGQKG